MAIATKNALYLRRRLGNTIAKTLAFAATAFGLGWLVLILGILIFEGIGGLSLSVFTENTPPPGSARGLLNAIMGSIVMTVLAIVISTPNRIPPGTYPPRDRRHANLARLVRFISD